MRAHSFVCSSAPWAGWCFRGKALYIFDLFVSVDPPPREAQGMCWVRTGGTAEHVDGVSCAKS